MTVLQSQIDVRSEAFAKNRAINLGLAQTLRER